jgi:hypothetical protein
MGALEANVMPLSRYQKKWNNPSPSLASAQAAGEDYYSLFDLAAS